LPKLSEIEINEKLMPKSKVLGIETLQEQCRVQIHKYLKNDKVKKMEEDVDPMYQKHML
jgi:uncharacterized protein YuzE